MLSGLMSRWATPVAVHHAQHLREGLDDLLGFFERPSLGTEDRALVLKNVLEGATFEPLQNDVRQLLALGGHQCAGIARLHDGCAAPRKLAEQRTLLHEVLKQPRALVDRHPVEALEALERHRQPPHQVSRPVDVRERALADRGLHEVLVADRRADDPQVVMGHCRELTRRSWGKRHADGALCYIRLPCRPVKHLAKKG